MKTILSRISVALLIGALVNAPQLLVGQTQVAPTVDPKKQAELDKKAAKQEAEKVKKAAEEAQKAEEKTRREEEKARKNAANHKNNDIDNIGNRNINKRQPNFTSIEEEIAVGKAASIDIEKSVQLVRDPVITEYVNRVGQNLVANSDAKVPFTIKVIDSEEINAFALPGGFFYINTGVILAADDEAEMAGVMAHEIAHVTARHAMENDAKASIWNIASIPLVIFGGPVGMILRQASSVIVPLQFISFSKNAEKEADYLGVQYLDKTGYDPSASVSFFEKLQAKEQAKPGTISSLFSSHPPTDDRILATKAEIETVLPAREKYVVTTSEFQRVKNRLIALQVTPTEEPDDNRPSLIRRRPGNRPEAGEEEDSTRPEDRQPEEDDRPVLQRR